VFRGSVKGTGYPLRSPVSTSLPLLRVTVCHHISTGVYSTVQSSSSSQLHRNPEYEHVTQVKLHVTFSL